MKRLIAATVLTIAIASPALSQTVQRQAREQTYGRQSEKRKAGTLRQLLSREQALCRLFSGKLSRLGSGSARAHDASHGCPPQRRLAAARPQRVSPRATERPPRNLPGASHAGRNQLS